MTFSCISTVLDILYTVQLLAVVVEIEIVGRKRVEHNLRAVCLQRGIYTIACISDFFLIRPCPIGAS